MSKQIPYDIIYLIYLNTTDYPTAFNFYILDKAFYKMYLQNKKTPKKKLLTLRFQEMFEIIENIPEMTTLSFKNLSRYSQSFLSQLRFVYLLYFQEISKVIKEHWDSEKSISLLTHAIMVNGFEHVNKYSEIIIDNNNKIKIKIFDLKGLLSYTTKYPFLWLQHQMIYFDIFII
jgi:hypothetical protein